MQFNVLKLKVCNNLRSAAMSHNDDGFFLSEKSSKARLREAENARKNRAEIVKAFSQGKVTRRELVKWGLITSGGLLAPIHGLNPFVNSAYASGGSGSGGSTAGNIGTGIPTGAPPSPTFGVQPFSTPMPRFDVIARGNNPLGGDLTPIPQAQANQTQQPLDPALVGGQTGLTGPIEGRPGDQSGRTRVSLTRIMLRRSRLKCHRPRRRPTRSTTQPWLPT
jgi:hypothetical protein